MLNQVSLLWQFIVFALTIGFQKVDVALFFHSNFKSKSIMTIYFMSSLVWFVWEEFLKRLQLFPFYKIIYLSPEKNKAIEKMTFSFSNESTFFYLLSLAFHIFSGTEEVLKFMPFFKVTRDNESKRFILIKVKSSKKLVQLKCRNNCK